MINRKIVMIPGPTPVVRSIQDQMGRETCAFGDSAFVKDYKSVVEDLKVLFDCSGQVFVIAGTGTLAMEVAVCNSVKAGDSLLIISHGYFGDRFLEATKRKGIDVDVLSCDWGKIVPIEEIEKKLGEKNYAAITVTHVDTATGVCAPVEAIGKMIRAKFPNTIYIVDGVCATAGIEEKVDAMGIDVLITGSQKAFGVAPGLAMIFAGKRSLQRRATLGDVIPEYYADFVKWSPIMDDPSKYFGTPAINLIWALQESIRIIKEEGVNQRYARHIKYGKAVVSALEALGFTILAGEDVRAATLSNVLYMPGVDDVQFRNMVQEEGIILAGGLGAYAGKMFRIGHMGNTDTHDLVCAIAAIERTLYRMNIISQMGVGVGALMKKLLD